MGNFRVWNARHCKIPVVLQVEAGAAGHAAGPRPPEQLRRVHNRRHEERHSPPAPQGRRAHPEDEVLQLSAALDLVAGGQCHTERVVTKEPSFLSDQRAW